MNGLIGHHKECVFGTVIYRCDRRKVRKHGISFEEAWENDEYRDAVVEETLRDLGYLIEPKYILVYNENMKNVVFFENEKYYSVEPIKSEFIQSVYSQNLGVKEISPMTSANKNAKIRLFLPPISALILQIIHARVDSDIRTSDFGRFGGF